MPGVTDVAVISTGVAVRGATPSASASTPSARCRSTGTRAPRTASPTPTCSPSSRPPSCRCRARASPLAKIVDGDVHLLLPQQQPARDQLRRSPTSGPDSAEVWSSLKSPIVAQEKIADMLGLAASAVKVHVMPGRRLVRPAPVLRRRARGRRGSKVFGQAGQADVAPHRRLPRTAARTRWRPRACARPTAAATCSPTSSGTRASRPTSPTGSARSSRAMAAKLPDGGNLGFAADDLRAHRRTCRTTSASPPSCSTRSTCGFHTGSMRNIYSPDVRTAQELDHRPAREGDGQGPVRSSAATFLKDARVARRARQGGAGRATGAARCRRARRRASPSTRSTRAVAAVPGRDRLPARRP